MARWAAGKFLILSGLLGIIAGVLVYDNLFPLLSGLGEEQRFITLPMILQIPFGYIAITLGMTFLMMSFFMNIFDPARKFNQKQEGLPILKREWGWLSTGAIAGLAIAMSAFMGEYLSFSGGFLALVAHVASFAGHPLQSVPTLSESTAWRAMLVIGLIPGAFISSLLAGTIKKEEITPLFQAAFGKRLYLRLITVFIGGVLMVVGALTGGGCTTGAFMSGWPTLSVGSFVMGMTFFGTAMFTAHILYFRRYQLIKEVREREGLNLAND
ncbi:MAG: YeeE/YedE thiosulfate transporter family protein [Nitrospirota bacterium]